MWKYVKVEFIKLLEILVLIILQALGRIQLKMNQVRRINIFLMNGKIKNENFGQRMEDIKELRSKSTSINALGDLILL